MPCVLCTANQWEFSGLQGSLAGTFWGWLCSEMAVCLSVELPAAISSTGGLWQQCHSLAGPMEFQPSSQVMAIMVDEESSSCLGFCHLPCLGTCFVSGCAIQHRDWTPSLPAEIPDAPHPAVNLACNSALLGAGHGDSPPASLRQPSPGCSPCLAPGSSSSPRAWAGFCWQSPRRGARGQKQYSGEMPPKPVRVRYLQPQPGQRQCSALGHGSGAGPSKISHLPEPIVCPSQTLAPCQESGVIPALPEVHIYEHFSHKHFKEQEAIWSLFTSCLCSFEGVHERPRVSFSAGTEPHNPFKAVHSSVTW